MLTLVDVGGVGLLAGLSPLLLLLAAARGCRLGGLLRRLALSGLCRRLGGGGGGGLAGSGGGFGGHCDVVRLVGEVKGTKRWGSAREVWMASEQDKAGIYTDARPKRVVWPTRLHVPALLIANKQTNGTCAPAATRDAFV